MHAALAPAPAPAQAAPDAPVPHAATQQDARPADAQLAAIARSLKLHTLLQQEFEAGCDAQGSGWQAVLALAGPLGTREWAVLRVRYAAMVKAHNAAAPEAALHVVPIEVRHPPSRLSLCCLLAAALHRVGCMCISRRQSQWLNLSILASTVMLPRAECTVHWHSGSTKQSPSCAQVVLELEAAESAPAARRASLLDVLQQYGVRSLHGRAVPHEEDLQRMEGVLAARNSGYVPDVTGETIALLQKRAAALQQQG